jgi:signal transduction histidine kinase/ligand-binding sensor domain-containing protein
VLPLISTYDNAGVKVAAFVVGALSLLLLCPSAFGLGPSRDKSQYAHTAWKVSEGFSKGAILSIAQTQDGYLWLGTELGLLRFDGVRATPWQPPGDQHLPSSTVWSLLTARDGTLWIGTAKGLSSWKGGKLTQYAELAGTFIYALLEDREGTVWVSGELSPPPGKLCAIQNGRVQCYGTDGTLGTGVTGLYEDSKGNLWVGVKNGLWQWKPGPPKFYPLPGEPNGIQAIGEDADGTLLVGWSGGIHRFDQGKTKVYPLPNTVQEFKAHRLLRDRDGDLWIGTWDRGLMHVHDGRTDVFAPPDGLLAEGVSNDLFEDREGSIWVATVNGLDKFCAVATSNLKVGLWAAIVDSVLAARDGSVWLSTNRGLNLWNNGRISTYDKREGKLNGRVPNSLFQDSRGRIWVSTFGGVGYLENDRFVSVSSLPGGSEVHAIAEDTAENLWIANRDFGLFELFRGSLVQRIPWTKLGHKDPANVLAAEPLQGGLWLGFFQGGIAYFKDGQVRASYSSVDGLAEGVVTDLRLDRDGTLWVATEGGLSRLKNGRIVTLTSKNGLPCDGVNWVIEDDMHFFWLNTPCGLVRIVRTVLDDWAAAIDKDKNTKGTIEATVFDNSDGVRLRHYPGGFSPHVGKSSDGKLWFANLDGVSVVDPRHLPFNKFPPPVQIEYVSADQKRYWQNLSSDNSSSRPRLPPLVRDVTIDYTALSFVAPEKVLFRYKLEGLDRDWQDVGSRRQAFYTNLSPGNYRFRVAACNNNGVWNEAGTFLDFYIAPAYYQTTWFRVLCVATFLGLLWALYQYRLHQLQRQFTAGLEARVTERTRIARELHDTLLQSFHGLMFQFQAVRNMLPRRPDEAMDVLDSAIGATEQAISEGRSAIQELRSEQVDEGDLAKWLTNIGEELARSRNMNSNSATFRVMVEGEQQTLTPLPRTEVCRITREILQNAFRHAQAHHIETEIRYDDRLLRVRIRDDGRGIDPQVLEAGGSAGHWGLRGAQERAQQIGARLDFWSEAGAGTEVELTIPAAVAYEKWRNKRRFTVFRKGQGL